MLARAAQLVLALLGAAGGAQLPAVIARYTHEAGARVRQASANLDNVATYAARNGVELADALDRLRAEGGVAGAAASDLTAAYQTLQRLEPAYYALTQAGPLTTPVAFVRHLHPAVLDAALTGFRPTLPLTPTGAAYAAGGAVVTLVIARLVIAAARRLRGRPKTETPA